MRSRGRISLRDYVDLVADVPADQVVAEPTPQLVGQLVAIVPHGLAGPELEFEADADLLGTASTDVQVHVATRVLLLPRKRETNDVKLGHRRLGLRTFFAELPNPRDETGLSRRNHIVCHGNGSL